MSLRIISLWSSIASSSARLVKRLQTCFFTCTPPTNSLSVSPPSLKFDHTDDVISNRLRSLNLYCTEHHLQVTRRIRDIEQLMLVAFLDAFQQILATPDPAAGSRPKSDYISLLVGEFERLYRLQLDSLFASLSNPICSTQSSRPAPKASGGRRQGRPHIFTKHQTSVLHELLQYDDKLTSAEKTFVGERLGLSKDQVNRWFCNARARRSNKKRAPSCQTGMASSHLSTIDPSALSILEPGLLDPRLRECGNDAPLSLNKSIDRIGSYSLIADCSGSSGFINHSVRPVASGSGLALGSQRNSLDLSTLSEKCAVLSSNESPPFDSPVSPELCNQGQTSPREINGAASPSTSSLLSTSSPSLTLTPPSGMFSSSHDPIVSTPPLQEISFDVNKEQDVHSPFPFSDFFLLNSFDDEFLFNSDLA
ncbi:hypothetical protein DFH28DRAFT_942378 [Melampsora americana]|nr:hypothetical protein DFH28DRAFT_942378 [Melampsora americana]